MEKVNMSHPHERWIRRLRKTWPEGIAPRRPEPDETPAPGSPEPWPDTWRDPDNGAMQCLHCRYYTELTGELGADWGACTSEQSQYDGQIVFEHWTCLYWLAEQRED